MLYPLYKLVEKDAWKEILLKMVETHKLDPWNIDIVEVSELFAREIAASRTLQYCANIILASAILLKMKSEALKQREEEPIVEGELEDIGIVPHIAICSRFPPKRQVTLDELIEEVEKVMKVAERAFEPKNLPMEIVEVEMGSYDLEEEKKEVLKVLEQGAMEFFEVAYALGLNERAAQVVLFLSLLHLFQSSEIEMEQDGLFGKIMVKRCQRSS